MGSVDIAEEALSLRPEDSPRPLFDDVLPLVARRQRELMRQVRLGLAAPAEALRFTSRALDWLLQARRAGLLCALEGDEALEEWQCDETQLEAELSARAE